MCKAESPQSQIGRSVRDTAEAVLNGVNSLVDYDVSNVKLAHTTSAQPYTAINDKLAKPH